METYTLPSFPLSYHTVHIALFHNVTNAAAIRQRLIQASTATGREGDRARAAVDYSFIEASMVVSRDHLLSTIFSTLITSIPNCSPNDQHPAAVTRTHNVHSELILNLYTSNNISEAMRKLGMSEKTTELVVVKIGSADLEEHEVWERIAQVVEGDLVSLDQLAVRADWAKVDKLYKLSELNQLKLKEEDLNHRKESAIINTITVKSVT